MRIGIFSEITIFNPPFPSGVARFFREITTELVRKGHQIFIFEPSIYSDQPKIEEIKDGITAYRTFSKNFTKYKHLSVPIPLKEIFFDIPFKLDIAHANSPGIAVLALITSYRQKIPRTISYHTPLIYYTNYAPLPLLPSPLVNYLERLVYNHFNLTIVPTQGVKNSLIERGFKGPFGFFPTCLNLQKLHKPSTEDLETFRKKFNLFNKKLVLFVGRMSPEKGVDQILRLVPAIIKEEPDVHFLMVGTGPYLEKYKKLNQNHNLSQYVTFTGYLNDFDLFNAISIADVGLIFVKEAQIFDMTILEYWNYGLPLIIRKAMGIDEVVADNQNGLLFSTLNEAKDKILNLLKNDELSAKIRKNCKKTVEKKYDITSNISQLEKLYRQCFALYYHY